MGSGSLNSRYHCIIEHWYDAAVSVSLSKKKRLGIFVEISESCNIHGSVAGSSIVTRSVGTTCRYSSNKIFKQVQKCRPVCHALSFSMPCQLHQRSTNPLYQLAALFGELLHPFGSASIDIVRSPPITHTSPIKLRL